MASSAERALIATPMTSCGGSPPRCLTCPNRRTSRGSLTDGFSQPCQLCVHPAASSAPCAQATHKRTGFGWCDDRVVLALMDLDERWSTATPCRRIPLWAQDFVTNHAFGNGALDWLEQTDRTVKARGRFFALVAHRFPGIGAASARWDDYRARMPQLVSAFPRVLEVLSRPRERRWRVAGLVDQLRNAGPGRGGRHRRLRRGAEQLSASRGCGGCGGRPARPQDSPAKGKS